MSNNVDANAILSHFKNMFPFSRLPRGSVVNVRLGIQGSWVRAALDPPVFFFFFFFSRECPWARHFRAQPSTGETQENMNNVICRRDMTEILLKAA